MDRLQLARMGRSRRPSPEVAGRSPVDSVVVARTTEFMISGRSWAHARAFSRERKCSCWSIAGHKSKGLEAMKLASECFAIRVDSERRTKPAVVDPKTRA